MSLIASKPNNTPERRKYSKRMNRELVAQLSLYYTYYSKSCWKLKKLGIRQRNIWGHCTLGRDCIVPYLCAIPLVKSITAQSAQSTQRSFHHDSQLSSSFNLLLLILWTDSMYSNYLPAYQFSPYTICNFYIIADSSHGSRFLLMWMKIQILSNTLIKVVCVDVDT